MIDTVKVLRSTPEWTRRLRYCPSYAAGRRRRNPSCTGKEVRLTSYLLLVLALSIRQRLCTFQSCHAFEPHGLLFRRIGCSHSSDCLTGPFRSSASSSSASDQPTRQIVGGRLLRQRDEYIALGQQLWAPYFDFPLDDWQLHAGGAISEGCHVMVMAPTGSGKTVVGEMALYHAIQQNLKGIYTTPLKALSNQKYADLIPLFGKTQVGLSTGDVSLNKLHARVTVMTTEVYRNLAWRADSTTATTTSDSSSSSSSSSQQQHELDETAVCVLDEFHYMGQPGRGGVWEESVITSPSHIQLVALSATLPNAPDLAQWMEDVTQRPTVLVQVPQQRPVPLRYLYATREGLYHLFRDPDAGPGSPKGLLGLRGDGAFETTENQKKDPPTSGGGFGSSPRGHDTTTTTRNNPTTVEDDEKIPRGLQVNPALRAAAEKRLQRVNRALERQKAQSYLTSRGGNDDDDDDELTWFRKSRSTTTSSRGMSSREERKERERLLKKELRRSVPSLPALVSRLDHKHLLPAIFFIFSRAGCDDAARTLYQTMKGPRDPSRLIREEVDEMRDDKTTSRDTGSKRKSRQRGRPGGETIVDMSGRTFRSSNNYISEDMLMSLYEPVDVIQERDRFDEYSPLSSENWDFYASSGLLSFEQVREVAARAARFNDENSEIAFDEEIVEQFLFGVGSHHAGMLPAHKSFVEVLYRNQLMKVVFATETLAAGINMPARTTVICALAKRGDSSTMNLLETSNLLQMAGRAGRRGMDSDGTCVIVATPFETHDDAAKILTDPVKPISSQFTPSYALAVNLIRRGEGKLDVARQLIGRSFAKWERNRNREAVAAATQGHEEAVSDLVHATAQERFMLTLAETIQAQVDRRRAAFDIAKLQKLLDVFNDRDVLKKTSKSYLGALEVLELERTTLAYLEKELETMRAIYANEDEELFGEFVREDESNLLDQIEGQKRRTASTEKELKKHPFTAIANVAHAIMAEGTPEGKALQKSLYLARQGLGVACDSLDLTASELSQYAKSVIVVQRKIRKLAVGSNTHPDSILELSRNEDALDESWNNVLAIVKTLLSYGCLSSDRPISATVGDLDAESYTLTPAGTNVAMLGLENSLWCVAAVGGAWDVESASSRLDQVRQSFIEGGEESLLYEANPVPKPRQEAENLLTMLRGLSASELAGYISALVSENSRSSATSVVDMFQRLTPAQQRVVQSSLLVMDRLMEVQKIHSVDESTRSCTL